MEMQSILSLKASEAIAALWLNQLTTISDATGIEMSVLCNCLNLQVPNEAPEKKKRAPAKKKETDAVVAVASQEAPIATEAVPEKKKRAPAKKKGVDEPPAKTQDSDVDALVDAVAELKINETAKSDDSVVSSESKKAKKEAEALQKKAKKEAEALEKAAKKEAEALEKKAKKEAEAIEKAAKKAGKKAEKKEEPSIAAAIIPNSKFKAHDKVRYSKSNGKTVNAVVEYVMQYDDRIEYKLQIIGTNETVLSHDDNTFAMPDNDDESCAETVMMPDSPPSKPQKKNKRPDVFLKNERINVERININGTSFLISENDIAFLESSKKMVGKYDPEDHSIRQLYSSEYDKYYGKSTESDSESDSSDDECPVLSDSDSDSDSFHCLLCRNVVCRNVVCSL